MAYATIAVSSLLSGISMPIIIFLAQKGGLYDVANERKIHTGNVPRLGGVGIFVSFVAVVFLLPLAMDLKLHSAMSGRVLQLVPFIAGAFAMHLTGLVDDLSGGKVRALPKLICQCAAAFMVVGSGFHFQGLGLHPDLLAGPLGWLSMLLSIGWIVGISNALNLIDGMDGLAGGIAFIVALTYAAFYLLGGDEVNSFICLALAGAIMGFLFSNFPAPRARLFMGDSGSLFIGFTLAVIPFLGQTADAGAGATDLQIGLLPAVLLLAVPMIDTLCAMWRRIRAHVSIMTADRLHIHHRFLDHGFSPIQILFIVYLLTVFQGCAFLLLRVLPSAHALLVEIICFFIVGTFFRFGFSLKPKV